MDNWQSEEIQSNEELEFVSTDSLVQELISRSRDAIIVLDREPSPDDGGKDLHFFSSFNFNKLSKMSLIAHAHMAYMSRIYGDDHDQNQGAMLD